MDVTLFATKGNLIAAKNSLKLSKQGYDLLDKKRNILIKEMMSLIEKAQSIQGEIDGKYREAYASLQRANISIGISEVEKISRCTHIEDGIDLKFRSVMGVEIPSIDYEEKKAATEYDFFTTPSSVFEIQRGEKPHNPSCGNRKFGLPSCEQHQKNAEKGKFA